jgi:hypothetical protein
VRENEMRKQKIELKSAETMNSENLGRVGEIEKVSPKRIVVGGINKQKIELEEKIRKWESGEWW